MVHQDGITTCFRINGPHRLGQTLMEQGVCLNPQGEWMVQNQRIVRVRIDFVDLDLSLHQREIRPSEGNACCLEMPGNPRSMAVFLHRLHLVEIVRLTRHTFLALLGAPVFIVDGHSGYDFIAHAIRGKLAEQAILNRLGAIFHKHQI